MKIFYIANVNLPTEKAHGIQIIKMCENFVAEGLEVELIVPKKADPIKADPINEIYKYYDVKNKFKITRLRSFKFLQLEKINKFLIYIQSLFFAFIVFFHVLFNPDKFGRNDILYLRDEFSPWLLAILNKKFFLEIHAFNKRYRYYRIFLSKIRGLILITKKAKERFIELGMDSEKILIAPDGVDLKIFDSDLSKNEARLKLNLPQDKKLLGYTGRFRTMGMDKGIFDILRAIKILNDDQIIFIAVGGSDAEIDYYKKIAEEAGIEKQIKLLPFSTQSQLAIYQKAFDVLLMPFPYKEHYAFYMSPLKMFEYMASQRPIIASDLPSVREILNENDAVLVEPDNPANLAKAIKKLLHDQELANQISERAYLKVQNYSWGKRAASIASFIKRN